MEGAVDIAREGEAPSDRFRILSVDGGGMRGLIPALGHLNHGSGHDAGAPSFVLSSAVDELLLRGPLDIMT